jgi:hypothetical protein
MLTILDLSWAHTLSGTLLWHRLLGSAIVRVWAVMSRGRGHEGATATGGLLLLIILSGACTTGCRGMGERHGLG